MGMCKPLPSFSLISHGCATGRDHANLQAQHQAAAMHPVWGESLLIVIAQVLVIRLIGAATLTAQMNARAKKAVGTQKVASDSCATERSALLIDDK